jgi:hypothetical protein
MNDKYGQMLAKAYMHILGIGRGCALEFCVIEELRFNVKTVFPYFIFKIRCSLWWLK